MGHPFTWFSVIPHADKFQHTYHALLALAILLFIAWRISISLKKSSNPLIPETRISFRNIFELVVQGIHNQLRGIIGPGGEKYATLIGGLFIYILICNLLGIIPGFNPPTGNINTNLAMALVVFLVYNYCGFKEHGLGYLKQFAGPVIYLAPLMFLIELTSHVFRPLSLSVRLFGNMFGDHTVLNIFSDLTYVAIPVIFMILGILVSLIQAFVFAVLATVYIALAVSHDH